MICVSLLKKTVDEVVEALSRLPLAEVRLEQLELTQKDVERIFHCNTKIVATNRPNGQSEQQRAQVLAWAIEAGAAYIDLEIESNTSFKTPLIEQAKAADCKVIISYHNYDSTPDAEELRRILDTCFWHGADIAKIACLVSSTAEAARIMGLGDMDRPVIPLGMGEAGKITRVAAPFVGAPFTFASMNGEVTAPGQIDMDVLEKMYTQLKVL